MTSVGVLGTGIVGRTLAARLAERGADVLVGARTADSASLEPFGALGVKTGSFADAAAHADLLINATNGSNSIAALESAGPLTGKTLIDSPTSWSRSTVDSPDRWRPRTTPWASASRRHFPTFTS